MSPSMKRRLAVILGFCLGGIELSVLYGRPTDIVAVGLVSALATLAALLMQKRVENRQPR